MIKKGVPVEIQVLYLPIMTDEQQLMVEQYGSNKRLLLEVYYNGIEVEKWSKSRSITELRI